MKKPYGIIYKATNSQNGKSYVGQTTGPLRIRIRGHKHDANRFVNYRFYYAIRKYGFEVFSWEILARANSSDKLNSLEKHFIKLYDTFGKNGYNMTEGGDSVSQEIIEKMRRTKLGKSLSEETKRKMSQSHLERYKDPVAIERQRLGGLARWSKDDHNREKFRAMMTGENNHQFGKIGSLSPCAKRYVITTPDNIEFEILSLTEFCSKWDRDKLNPKNLNMCVKGKRNHHHGYKCRYANTEERATTIESTPEWWKQVEYAQVGGSGGHPIRLGDDMVLTTSKDVAAPKSGAELTTLPENIESSRSLMAGGQGFLGSHLQ